MKLTEAKLKQMITEALKSRFQDLGIPTPDEKLKADFGSETYEKIQGLDKDQADIMKQSLDPNYPQEVKAKTLRRFMESHGFEFHPGETVVDNQTNRNVVYHTMYFYRQDPSPMNRSMETLYFEYRIVNDEKGQTVVYDIHFEEMVSDYEFQYRGYIKVPDMFDFRKYSEETAESVSALVLIKERERLEKLVKGEFDDPAI